MFFKDIKEMLPVFATVGAVALLGGVFTAIRSSSGAQSTENVTFLVTFSAVLLPVLTTVTACFTAAKSALDSVEKQIQLIFPVLLTLMSVSGKTATRGGLYACRGICCHGRGFACAARFISRVRGDCRFLRSRKFIAAIKNQSLRGVFQKRL